MVNFSRGNIFEIVRVSYLMANKKAVICDFSDELEIEDDLRRDNTLRFVRSAEIQSACQALVADAAAREAYAAQGYECFKQRDIRQVITGFFD